VAGADDLDGGDEDAAVLGVVDADLVRVLFGQVRLDRERRRQGGLRCRYSLVVSGIRRGYRLVVGEYVYLEGRAEVDVGTGAKSGWEDGAQVADDLPRPLAVNLVPGVGIVDGRTEVVAERHRETPGAAFPDCTAGDDGDATRPDSRQGEENR